MHATHSDTSATLIEVCDAIVLERDLDDDEHAFERLRRARWPDGFVCPRCGGRRATWLHKRRLWQCRECRRQTSLTAGTAFAHSRLEHREILISVDCLEEGKSARELSRRLNRPYPTSWRNAQKGRRAIRHDQPPLEDDIEQAELVVPTEVLLDEPTEEGVGVSVRVDRRGRIAGRVVSPQQRPPMSGFPAHVCLCFFGLLRRIHAAVSTKYLRRYLDAFIARRAGVDWLRAAMMTPHCPASLMHRFP